MNIWLDDQRKAPAGWVHLHNIEEVEQFIQSVDGLKDFCIEKMSFDFNLSHPKNGVDIMKYLADQCRRKKTRRFWPKTILYHSNDLEGINLMKAFAISFESEQWGS